MPSWRETLWKFTAGIFIAYILQRSSDHREFNAVKNPHCNSETFLYSLDGSCNNLHHPTWGRAGTQYSRLALANYSSVHDIECAVRKSVIGGVHSLTKKVKHLLTHSKVSSHEHTPMYYVFGQWINYDISYYMSMKAKGAEDCACCRKSKDVGFIPVYHCLPMVIPPEDEFYSEFNVTCIDLLRANNSHNSKSNLVEPCVPINFQTGFLDLSTLYGSDSDAAEKSRSFRDGKLKCLQHSDPVPRNRYQSISSTISNLRNCAKHGGDCSKTDDSKGDPSPELQLMGSLFHRVHNKLAFQLSGAEDDTIFREARRYLIAAYQHVVYNEYIPATIGFDVAEDYDLLPFRKGQDNEYMPQLSPQTPVEYAFAVSYVARGLNGKGNKHKDSKNKTTPHNLYHRLDCLRNNEFRNLIASYISVENTQSSQTTEGKQQLLQIMKYVNSTSDIKYSKNLLTVDVLRGLDAGLPTYNEARRVLNLGEFKEFEDLERVMSTKTIEALKKLYGSVNDIDLYVGGLLENHFDQYSRLGPTFSEIFKSTFYRLKFGDRLHYTFPSAKFNAAELREIRKVTFSYLMCVTIFDKKMKLPKNAFLKESDHNPAVNCEHVIEHGPNLQRLEELYRR